MFLPYPILITRNSDKRPDDHGHAVYQCTLQVVEFSCQSGHSKQKQHRVRNVRIKLRRFKAFGMKI